MSVLYDQTCETVWAATSSNRSNANFGLNFHLAILLKNFIGRSASMTRYPSLTRNAPFGSQIEERFVPRLEVEQAISKLVQDEIGKRQYYRPIYSLHKW